MVISSPGLILPAFDFHAPHSMAAAHAPNVKKLMTGILNLENIGLVQPIWKSTMEQRGRVGSDPDEI